jgi:hypothetical protein
MYRTNSNGNQILRRFVQQAESYNRCMFPKQSKNLNDNHITEQILFCQNQINNLNISSKNKNSVFVSYFYKFYPRENFLLMSTGKSSPWDKRI